MNVLVVSDSHGMVSFLRRIIEREKDCKTVFFLGDGVNDIERCAAEYPEKKFIIVKGNNDFACPYPEIAYKHIEGNTIAAVHGHLESVRYSLAELCEKTSAVMGNVAFYGHTHIARTEFDGRVTAINPGAVCEGSYAVVELTRDGPRARHENILR